MLTALLCLVVSLPLAVYTYAGLYLLIDRDNALEALLPLTFRLSLVAALLILAPASARPWIGAGFLAVALLHLLVPLVIRIGMARGRWIAPKID